MYIVDTYGNLITETELYHHGIKGQKWGIRRYQNPDGSLTDAGKRRYGGYNINTMTAAGYTRYKNDRYKDMRQRIKKNGFNMELTKSNSVKRIYDNFGKDYNIEDVNEYEYERGRKIATGAHVTGMNVALNRPISSLISAGYTYYHGKNFSKDEKRYRKFYTHN